MEHPARGWGIDQGILGCGLNWKSSSPQPGGPSLDPSRQAGLSRSGFLCDPGKVVGIPVCDRPRRDTRYLVRVLPLCPGYDLGNPAAAGVQRHPALAALVNFATPSVDRLDG